MLQELRAALDGWMADTHDMGAMAEEEMIRRGIVADRLKEYSERVQPLEIPLTPRKQ